MDNTYFGICQWNMRFLMSIMPLEITSKYFMKTGSSWLMINYWKQVLNI